MKFRPRFLVMAALTYMYYGAYRIYRYILPSLMAQLGPFSSTVDFEIVYAYTHPHHALFCLLIGLVNDANGANHGSNFHFTIQYAEIRSHPILDKELRWLFLEFGYLL